LTILDILARKVNQTRQKSDELFRQGQGNLSFDDWLHQLNQVLKQASHDCFVKKSQSEKNKEEVKRFGKLFEDLIATLKLDEKNQWIQVATLVYSYLEPATKVLNKKQQAGLTDLKK
jgi:hypothetical protein